ncbi:MAG: SagB/ThcOx family dehydrogenase [Candidatus Thorarchaeota archaeon]|jgi:SagB-type dehydrogenase family enzyme
MLGIGDDFYRKSKYTRGNLPRHRLDWSSKPPTYKRYESVQKVQLPDPISEGGAGLWKVLNIRRSRRAYADDPLTLEDLSQLVWATQGVTANVSDHDLRTAPSAGALYPIETYICVNRVSDLESGLYHYSVPDHELDFLKPGKFGGNVSRGALDQKMTEKAAVVFIWSAIFQRSKWKYLQRAYRYIFLDAGHIAQNLALAAEALGYGTCQIGAIYDDELNELLDLDGEDESVIYLSTVAGPQRQIERG